MKASGAVFTSNPPMYEHECTHCGQQNNYIRQYPYVAYAPVSIAAKEKLLPSEERVLRCILAGQTTFQAIALALCISECTVRSHLAHIREKFHLNSMVEIVLWAWRNGYRLPEVEGDAHHQGG